MDSFLYSMRANGELDISSVCPRSLFDLRIFADFKNVCRCMAHKCTIVRSSSNTEVVVSGHIELQRIGCSLRAIARKDNRRQRETIEKELEELEYIMSSYESDNET